MQLITEIGQQMWAKVEETSLRATAWRGHAWQDGTSKLIVIHFLGLYWTVFKTVLEAFESSKVERRQKAAREMELEVLKEEGLGKVRTSWEIFARIWRN